MIEFTKPELHALLKLLDFATQTVSKDDEPLIDVLYDKINTELEGRPHWMSIEWINQAIGR